MKTTKKLMIYKLNAVISELDNKVHEIILLAKNEEEARSNAREYAHQFSEATNVKCYEIGVASKNVLTKCLKSPWMGIVCIHIEEDK